MTLDLVDRRTRWPVTPNAVDQIDLTTNPRRHRKDRRRHDGCSEPARWTTFLVTLLIILTLVVDAWDFLSKLADDRDGLGAPVRHRLVPAARALRHRHAGVGTLHRHRDRDARGGTARPRRRRLPGRVRHASSAAHGQADRRDPWPASRAWCSATSRSRSSTPSSLTRLFSGADQAFTLAAAGIGVGDPDDSDHRHPSPRTPCAPCRWRCARRSYGLGAQRDAVDVPGRVPGRHLGHRRRHHPRHLASDRRDDGGRHRGRSSRRWALAAAIRSIRGRR